MTTTLADLLKDSAYRLDQFKPEHIAALEAGIALKESDKAPAPYVTCLVRSKPIKLTPEEAVRQLYLRVLHLDLGYPVSRIAVEYEVTFGREKKRADICIFDKDRPTTPYILVELKSPSSRTARSSSRATATPPALPWACGPMGSKFLTTTARTRTTSRTSRAFRAAWKSSRTSSLNAGP